MSRILRFLLVATFCAVCSPLLHAQNATVLGTVYDSKGAPMPGVTVLLQNKATGFLRVTVTGPDGSYSIPEVPPADGYTVTANKEGADMDSRQNISVNVGDERSILPPLREPAPVAPVTSPETPGTQPAQPGATQPAAPVVAPPTAPLKAIAQARPPKFPNATVRNESTSTSIGGVITGDQLRSLPLYNRNFLVLGLLSPNVHDVEAGSPLTGASFSISGLRAAANNFLLDGVDNVASSSGQAIPFQVNDAIQEFRVTSATANAEYGRGAGGVVSVVTRRGTNQFHGAAFGYFGNDIFNSNSPLSVYNGSGFDRAASYAGSLNSLALTPSAPGNAVAPTTYNQYVATARANGYCTNSITVVGPPSQCLANSRGRADFFNPAAILSSNNKFKAPFNSKQFGANIGGPIVKDKMFIFTSYEATLIDNPASVFERVPSAFDRLTRNPADPNYRVAQKVLSLFPVANVVGVPGVMEFFQGQAPNYTNVHNALARLDWSRSQKNTYNVRFAGQLIDQLHDETVARSANYGGNGSYRNAQNQNAAFTWNHTFMPKLLNEARVAFTQFRVTETPRDAGFDAKTLGLPNSAMPTISLSGLDTQYSGASQGVAGAYGGWFDSFWAANPTSPMLPSLDGQFPFARLGAPFNAPGQRRDSTYAFADNLTWNMGKHSFKFGSDFRFIQNKVVTAGFSRGTIVSGDIGEFTSDSETCNAALVGGLPCGQAFRAPSFDYALNQQSPFNGLFNSYNYSFYGQDSWKLPKHIQINMGVRYDYFGVPLEVNKQIWNFDPVANGLVQQGGSEVFDPYGYSCGLVPRLDAVVVDRSFGQSQGWTCKSSKNGRIVKPDYNDFSGRFGFAWDVFGDARTVLRAGVGIFYDQVPASYQSQLMFNRPTPLNLANPRYIYGQNFLGSFVPGSNGTAPQTLAGSSCQQCGFGNSTVNPSNLQTFFQSAASPFVLYARDTDHSRTPYARQTSVTVQQQFTNNFTLEAGYIGTGGKRLPFVNNNGFTNEWFCTSSRIPVAGPTGSTAPTCDTFSYFPIFTMANVAESRYHSLMVRGRVNQFHGLRLNATYTWAVASDNASSANFPLVPTPLFTQAFGLQFFGLGNPFGFSLGKGGNILGRSAGAIGQTGTIAGADTFSSSVTTTGAAAVIVSRYNLPQDPINALADDDGHSDFDIRHRLVLDYNYDLPFFKQSKWLGGWQVSGIFTAQTGQPFTIYSGPVFGELVQRVTANTVTLTGNPNDYINGSFGLPAKVTDPLASPATQCGYASGASLYSGTAGSPCIGNSPRNGFTGPAYMSFDMAVQKGFKLFGESKELTLRTEAFNLFNRANYYNPISVISLDGFNPNPDFGHVKSAHDPRQLQFAIRFTF